ncbi:MAG TPA: metabolite traffic protein EboE [Pirellula sp.]|nr:metabolite traffic protein EboE [Pirellula sp.]
MTNSANSSIPKSYQVGYCTNVHAGRDLPSVMENLANHCHSIRKLVALDQALCVGLWFSEISAAQAIQSEQLARLKNKLAEFQLVPFTLNGFPQGDFHSQVVKHRVYKPTWWQPERLDYTLNLIQLLDQILPLGQIGSISTLPIAWGSPVPSRDQLRQAASQLVEVARALHKLFEHTGRKIVLAIEPEPGCYLTDSASFRMFYNQFLRSGVLPAGTSKIVGDYLTLCHDVCHAAVMYEDQKQELHQLQNDEIAVGKVQVSSAIQVEWETMSVPERNEAFNQLRGFAEDRYLHQTNRKNGTTSKCELVEDLPIALSSVSMPADLVGQWRIHFHVPIYLQQFGLIRSTQNEITKLLDIFSGPASQLPVFTGHFEVETYAWGVLPEAMRLGSLNEGIAKEILWLKNHLAE